MSKLTPTSPLRSDHRFLTKLISLMFGSKVEYKPSEFNRTSRVFLNLGGSWEKVFLGDPKNISLLKKVLKKAVKLGLLSKREQW